MSSHDSSTTVFLNGWFWMVAFQLDLAICGLWLFAKVPFDCSEFVPHGTFFFSPNWTLSVLTSEKCEELSKLLYSTCPGSFKWGFKMYFIQKMTSFYFLLWTSFHKGQWLCCYLLNVNFGSVLQCLMFWFGSNDSLGLCAVARRKKAEARADKTMCPSIRLHNCLSATGSRWTWGLTQEAQGKKQNAEIIWIKFAVLLSYIIEQM